jgi:hypothetical protein
MLLDNQRTVPQTWSVELIVSVHPLSSDLNYPVCNCKLLALFHLNVADDCNGNCSIGCLKYKLVQISKDSERAV